MNWDNPEDRAALIERVGVEEYNRLHAEHRKASVVATVNGHDIRPVGSRFGRLFMVGDTGRAFSTQPEAEAFARGEVPRRLSGLLRLCDDDRARDLLRAMHERSGADASYRPLFSDWAFGEGSTLALREAARPFGNYMGDLAFANIVDALDTASLKERQEAGR